MGWWGEQAVWPVFQGITIRATELAEIFPIQHEVKYGAGMRRRSCPGRINSSEDRNGLRTAGGIRFTFCVPVCYSIIDMGTINCLKLFRWFWLVMVPLALVVGTGNVRVAGAAEAIGPGNSSPEVVLQQVHMLETREGARLWEIRADQVEVNEREGFTVLTRVTRPIEIAFYSSQGRVSCVANRATLDLKTKDVRLEGAVLARSDQGVELRTELLQWIAASHRLQTDQPVTIVRGGPRQPRPRNGGGDGLGTVSNL